MRTLLDKKKVSRRGLMITIKQIMKVINRFCIILITLLIEGSCSSTTSVEEVDDYTYKKDSELFVSVRCVQIGKNDTMDICYPYHDLVYQLEEDSLTHHLCNTIEDYVLNGRTLVLPENHFLLQKAIVPDMSIDSVYMLGHERLLREYFFCHNELDKERSCCLDWLHSACGNSVYFGHRSTPCYYKEGDEIMDDNKIYYIISLLYKHKIYCMLDDNGNICLLNTNLKEEDFYHIPFPIVEIR